MSGSVQLEKDQSSDDDRFEGNESPPGPSRPEAQITSHGAADGQHDQTHAHDPDKYPHPAVNVHELRLPIDA